MGGRSKRKRKTFTESSPFSGCFHLSDEVVRGVVRKGYTNPTPIQRKSIPIIMNGKDVVAMARTGSGKTACFLLPILHHLKEHDTCGAPRGLILSPTRELALQTFTFFKELAKYTGLRASVIIGGGSIDRNFEALHSHPDVIIATPGRLMHVLVEMDMKLSSIKFFVLDEADRLFELGFLDQIKMISKQIGINRQTLLFSATLPQTVTEFTRIGLHDPVLLRLDKDEKLSDMLKLEYFYLRTVEKIPLLLYLLNEKFSDKEKTAVFLPTKHYVEYVHELLNCFSVPNTFVYSSLDQEARTENIEKFSFRGSKCNILLVTDIAARGIDIPILDNVVNFNFPCSPKLFLHRVGRVARGGRSGTAISFVTNDELAYYIDVHLFLAKPIRLALNEEPENLVDNCEGVLGEVNKSVISDYSGRINTISNTAEGSDLLTLQETADRSLIQYQKTCPPACHESNKRAKDLDVANLQIHPTLIVKKTDASVQDFLNSIRGYKSNKTIFEINPMKNMTAFTVMQQNRKRNMAIIDEFAAKKQKKEDEKKSKRLAAAAGAESNNNCFIPYFSTNQHSEKGLEISQFEKEIRNSAFDMLVDDEKKLAEQQRSKKTWDRKEKRLKGVSDNDKKIVTESGQKISASFRTGLYSTWLKNKGSFINKADNTDDKGFDAFVKSTRASAAAPSGADNELKKVSQVAKLRRKKARRVEFDKRRHDEKKQKAEARNKTGKQNAKHASGRKKSKK